MAHTSFYLVVECLRMAPASNGALLRLHYYYYYYLLICIIAALLLFPFCLFPFAGDISEEMLEKLWSISDNKPLLQMMLLYVS